MQSPGPEGNVLSPLPTDSISSFLGYVHRRFSDFTAPDSGLIPNLPQEHPSNANDESSSAFVGGISRTMFESHTNTDVTNQHNPPRFTESPSLHRAG